MSAPTWWTYLRTTAGTEIGRVIADAAGVTPPQVSRWKSGENRPDAGQLVAFARHYRQPPVAALIAGGYLTESEAAEVIEVHRGLDAITDEELLAEVGKRMKGAIHAVSTESAETPSSGTSGETGQGEEGRPNVIRPAHWNESPTPPPVDQAQAASRGEKKSDNDPDDDDEPEGESDEDDSQ